MKIRSGFVSNSSSSSFVVAVKSGELTQERLMAVLGVSEKSPLYGFAKEIADFVLGEWRRDRKATIAQWLADSYYHTIEDVLRDYGTRPLAVELLMNGWIVLDGSASDEGSDEAERWVCYNSIDYRDDNLVFWSAGGY